ncbi:hypothetical protein Droror1_Dr00018105 [Drosera rotundifolia]
MPPATVACSPFPLSSSFPIPSPPSPPQPLRHHHRHPHHTTAHPSRLEAGRSSLPPHAITAPPPTASAAAGTAINFFFLLYAQPLPKLFHASSAKLLRPATPHAAFARSSASAAWRLRVWAAAETPTQPRQQLHSGHPRRSFLKPPRSFRASPPSFCLNRSATRAPDTARTAKFSQTTSLSPVSSLSWRKCDGTSARLEVMRFQWRFSEDLVVGSERWGRVKKASRGFHGLCVLTD